MVSHPAFPALTLTVTDLTVARGERVLFERLGFSVPAGSVLMLRGPNGAGKSSLIACLSGLSRPAAGRIEVDGLDTETPPGMAMHLVGHLTAVRPRLTLAETLDFWAALNGPGEDTLRALATVGLSGLDWLEAGHLSAGQTRRLALARLLVSKRPIWLLDEPTASLDTEGEALVARLLADHLSQGGLAVVATHQHIALPDGLTQTALDIGARR